MEPKSAQDWVNLYRQGDERAFQQIFKALYKPLCFFAYKILRDEDKAEDIVQDNLLKLWQKREKFLSIEKIKSFLYITVRNSCYDDLEHQKVKTKHEQYVNHSEEMSERNILDTIVQAEVIQKIFVAVDHLPEQCQRIIKMTFEEGKTPKEISEALGITISTVSNQKRRGLILLKRRLSEKDVVFAAAILLPGFL